MKDGEWPHNELPPPTLRVIAKGEKPVTFTGLTGVSD